MTALALVLLPGWLALGGGVPDSCGAATARAHIRQGHSYSDQGNETAALTEFRCALEVDVSPEALAQVGLAEMALGRWVQAEADLDRAMSQTQDAWIRDHRAPLVSALETIRDNLGDLMIDGGPAGAQILIDGKQVAQLPLVQVLHLPTGRIDIEVRANGFVTAHRERKIEARMLAREMIDLVPSERPTEAAVPSPPSPGTTATGQTPPSPVPLLDRTERPPEVSRWPAWVSLGASLISLSTAVAFHLARESHAHDFNEHCDLAKPSYGGMDCPGRYEEIQRDQKLYIAGYIGAAVFGAASAYFFVTISGKTQQGTAHAFSCGALSGVYGLACGGRF